MTSTNGPSARSPDEAKRHCQEIAGRHYENFPTASMLLPARARQAIAAIYAFARTADDFADEPEFAGRRAEMIATWRTRLDEAAGDRPEGPVFVALARAIREHELPVDQLHALLDAFQQDVVTPRYATLERVLDYCSRSANPIGRLVLAVHGIRDDRSVAASDAICTGLQLTNFWQDVAVDLDKDRIYLPAEHLDRFGVTEPSLFSREASPAFRRLLAHEVALTRDIFAAGRPLAAGTKGRLGLWLRLVWAGGHGILDRIEGVGFDVFTRRPTLGKLDWLALSLPAPLGHTARRSSAGAAAQAGAT
jgi:phytoene synthase